MKRYLLITAFLLALPLISVGKSGYTAYAGHTIGGGYCQYGCPGCLVDPGDLAEPCMNSVEHPDKGKPTDTGERSIDFGLVSLSVVGLTMLTLLLKRFTA